MWMLVEHEELDVSIELPALVFAEALTAATEGGLVRDHRRAAMALARSLGLDTSWSELGTLWVGVGAERVEISFDAERRMTRLDASPVLKSA